MKYGKLIDNRIQYADTPLRINNEDVFTNDSAIFLSQGYKKIVYTEPPEAPEGFYPEPHWTETDTQIVQKWELVPLPDEIDYETAYNELTEVLENDTE